MKCIELSRGQVAIVDDEDYEYLAQWRWNYDNGYARRKVTIEGKSVNIHMHREILKTPPGMQTDHINGNRADNRRCNLRICTRSQNQQNRALNKNSSTGVKGVSYRKNARSKPFLTQLEVSGKSVFRKAFATLEEARIAYAEQTAIHFGEFARLN